LTGVSSTFIAGNGVGCWVLYKTSLNVSWVAGCLGGGCFRAIGKIGKPIWLVSLLLWMRAAGSLAGDWTAIFCLAAEA
jgi:hypothetical protein